MECGRFGPINGTIQKRLDVAYGKFLGFCRQNKISTSQPPFTEKMDLWLTRAVFLKAQDMHDD